MPWDHHISCGRGDSLETTTFLVVEVNALGPLHVLYLWLGVSNGMLPVKYFAPTKPHFCVSLISWRSCDCHKAVVFLATLCFVDNARYKILASVCLTYRSKKLSSILLVVRYMNATNLWPERLAHFWREPVERVTALHVLFPTVCCGFHSPHRLPSGCRTL